MGLIAKILSGCVRRLLGGWLYTVDIIKERAVQWVLGIILYSLIVLCKIKLSDGYSTWLFDNLNVYLFTLLGSVSIVYCMTKSHFPSFLCGAESQEYIDEQLAKGRNIAYKKIVDWLGTKRGFEPFDKEWCFWHLMLCKTVPCILPALFFGYQFIIVGALVAFAYNAMFWVNLKPYRNVLTSPTNWGEFWQGFFIVDALL